MRPRSPGLGPLGLLGTAALLGGIIAALLLSLVISRLVAVATLGVVLLVIALTSTPWRGRSVGSALATRIGWRRRRWRRAHQYRTGALSNLPVGVGRPLPGVLASVRLLEVIDGFDRSVAVLYRPGRHHYTVVLRCVADGVGLMEPEVVEQLVAGYGGFLAALGQEPGLLAASVIVDGAPDTGTWLASEHQRTLSPDSPPLARQVLAEVVAASAGASPHDGLYVAVSYSGRALHRRARDTSAVATELARRLPGLIAALEQAGGGTVEPVTAAELPAVIRAAYDPGAQEQLAAAVTDGQPVDLSWAEAGPVAAEEGWDTYRHDSGISVTWEMIEAPRGTVFSGVLAPLLQADPDFVRKRVALIYRPVDPAEAATITQRDASTSVFTARSPGGRVSALSERVIEATHQSEREVAAGAGLTRFAVAVTITVRSGDDLAQANATLERLGRISRLSLRPSYGHQAAAFALTLPVGFLPWEHVLVPAGVRDQL